MRLLVTRRGALGIEVPPPTTVPVFAADDELGVGVAVVGDLLGPLDDGGSEGCDVAATVGKRVGAIDDGGSEGCDVVATVGKTVRKAGVDTAVGISVGKRVDVIGAAAGWAGVRVDAVAFRMGDGAKEGHTMEFPAASDGTRVGSPDTANSAGAMVPHSGP